MGDPLRAINAGNKWTLAEHFSFSSQAKEALLSVQTKQQEGLNINVSHPFALCQHNSVMSTKHSNASKNNDLRLASFFLILETR